MIQFFGRICACVCIRAEELHGDGVLIFGNVYEREGLLVAVENGICGDHLHGYERRSLLHAENAERLIRDAGHGAEDEAAADGEGTDFYDGKCLVSLPYHCQWQPPPHSLRGPQGDSTSSAAP